MRAGDEIYYELAARYVQAGASTEDGQDITTVGTFSGGMVYIEVYTPSDDPERDAAQREASEVRVYKSNDPVKLAVFADSDVDLSTHDHATNHRPGPPTRL